MAEQHTPTVSDMQRELLAICKGGSYFTTWATINGMPCNERTSLRGQFDRLLRIGDLRRKIHAINPNAALYFGWAPEEDGPSSEQEFRAAIATTKQDPDHGR